MRTGFHTGTGNGTGPPPCARGVRGAKLSAPSASSRRGVESRTGMPRADESDCGVMHGTPGQALS